MRHAAILCLVLAWGCSPEEPGGFGRTDTAPAAPDPGPPPDPDLDQDGYPASTDCDDEDPWTWPGAPELCDGLDNDCDGVEDEEPLANLDWYVDEDEDGFGGAELVTTGCIGPPGTVPVPGDCDDAHPGVHPGALADGIDSDCDGRVEWRVSIWITVVQAYELCVDGVENRVGTGGQWENAERWDVWLDSGIHTVGFEGVGVEWDDEDEELTGALVSISISNGTEWWSNSNWRYDPNPTRDPKTRLGWCSTGFDDSTWQPAREFGQWGVPPWGALPSGMESSPASWIWDDVPIEHRTQYFRREIELP